MSPYLFENKLHFFIYMTKEEYLIFHCKYSHFIVYEIKKFNQTYLNWIWYRRVEKEMLSDFMKDRNGIIRDFTLPATFVPCDRIKLLMQEAQLILPEMLSFLVQTTKAPFLQPIFDKFIDRMSFKKVALLGDAGCLARPHVTASSYKSYLDGLKVVEVLLKNESNVVEALEEYSRTQVPIGRDWVLKSRAMGNLDCYIRPQF